MLHHARYWRYLGSHPQGGDCYRYDPHNYGVDLIGYMVYIKDGGDCYPPLRYSDTISIKTTWHKKTKSDFGIEVSVAAPPEIWEKAKQSLEAIRNFHV